jgi:DNA polymerase-3 subunit beta
MKFSCEKALLLQAINVTSRTVAAKSSIPALEGILVEATDILRLTGYNLETGIQATVPADITQTGSLVLSARLFGEIVRRLPDEIVEFTSDNFMVNIKCGISEFNILGTDAAEFPSLPSVDYVNSVKMEQGKLKSMISQTLFAVSTNQARPIHTGSLFEVDAEGGVTVVSVDGYRLALRKESSIEKAGIPDFSFVVPGAALSEVEKICTDTDDQENPVEFVQGGRHIMFKVNNITLIARRLEGEFLNYRQAVPQNNPVALTVARKMIMASVDRVSLIITEKQKSPLRCTFSDNIMKIQTNTAIGNAYDECYVNGDGQDLEIGFNNKYLMDALKAAPAEELRLELNTPISPCLIKPADGSDSFLYMVLPVRLRAN